VRAVVDRGIEIGGTSPPSAYTGNRVASIAHANPFHPSVRAPGCEGVARTGPSTAKSQPIAPARAISATP